MPIPRTIWEWLRLPRRVALLLGAGALSAAGAQAETATGHADRGLTRVPLQSAKSFGDVLIWSDGGRIYVAESDKPAEELHLGYTPEARRLREMLERDGAVPGAPRAVPHRMILAGSGGDGFHRGVGRVPAVPAGQMTPSGAGTTVGGENTGVPVQRSPKQQPQAPRDWQLNDREKNG